jgi:hypothetical protein
MPAVHDLIILWLKSSFAAAFVLSGSSGCAPRTVTKSMSKMPCGVTMMQQSRVVRWYRLLLPQRSSESLSVPPLAIVCPRVAPYRQRGRNQAFLPG